MKTFVNILIVLLYPLIGLSELIDGPANIRLEPQKDIFLSLHDSVEVDCAKLNNNYYRIGISIRLTEEQFSQDDPIKPGDKLVNWKGEVIGEAIAKIPDSISYTWSSGGAPGNPKRFGMEIFGYTYKSNIKRTSIPEILLPRVLEENKTNLNFEAMSSYINQYGFQETALLKRLYPSIKEYYISESTVYDPSPMDRIRLIFYDANLIAIVHTRDIEGTSTNDYELVRGRKLFIVHLPEIFQIEEFIDKNITAYDGID